MKLTKRQLRQIIFETVTDFDASPVGRVNGNVPEINVGHDHTLSRATINKNKKKHKAGTTPLELRPDLTSQDSDFGYVRDAEKNLTHQGLDIFGRIGAPVQAVIDSFVHYARFERGKGGGVIVLASKNPISGESSNDWKYSKDTEFIRYAHLKTITPGSSLVGKNIRAGALIGTLGATGSAHEFTLSDGTIGGHIHMSVYGTDNAGNPYYEGPQKDPAKFMSDIIQRLQNELSLDLEAGQYDLEMGGEGDYLGTMKSVGASEEQIQHMMQNQEEYYEMLRKQAEEIEKYNK